MTKYLFRLAVIFGMYLFTVGIVHASNLSVQIQQPKTPTNQNTFDITFVALDIQNRAIIAKCFKKGPSDSSFTQFGSDISLIAGGNTDVCQVNSSVVSSEGAYNFYVTATAGSDSFTSSTVTLDHKNSSGPDTPGNYSKEQTSSCNYTIKFKTANDGKTSKVRIYRSTEKSFTAGSSTEVGTINIGPNLEGSFANIVPDCGKTYYFAIRAFDDLGNGSGTTGDSFTTTIIDEGTTQTTTTEGGQGAIPVSSSSVGEILGEQSATSAGVVLGEQESTSEASPKEVLQASTGIFSKKNMLYGTFILGIVLLAYLKKKGFFKSKVR